MIPSYESSIALETEAAEPQFEELLELAIETTLTNPGLHEQKLALQEPVDHDEDTELFRSIGLWVTANTYIPDNTNMLDEIKKSSDENERLYLPYKDAIQDKIQAYGEALLEEAFSCLGPDALAKANELKNAKTSKQAIKVCDWLIGRLYEIKKMTKDDETPDTPPEERHFYHPARLSPKFIGQYPNIKTQPTCLSYSLLVASFFEKAELPYMHAGVVRTAKDEARDSQQLSIIGLTDASRKHKIDIPIQMERPLADALGDNMLAGLGHDGFHAAVIAQLTKDCWIQMDPNYYCNVLFGNSANKDLVEAYEFLGDMDDFSRGSEYKYINYPSHMTGLYSIALNKLTERLSTDIDDISDYLKEIPSEEAFAHIVQKYFHEFFDRDSELYQSGIDFAIGTYCNSQDIEIDEWLQDTVYTTLLKYVFPDAKDGDLSECIERCHTDPAYRRNRAEDLVLAPLYTLLSLQSQHGNAIIKDKLRLPHSVMDTGLPAYRIGISVLSDFASYCGDELPLSFWMTYWPSAVSFAEHHENSDTPLQVELKKQIITDMKKDGLNYNVIGGIIRKSNE